MFTWLRKLLGLPIPEERVPIVSFAKERPLSRIDSSALKVDPSDPDLAPAGSRCLSDDGQRVIPRPRITGRNPVADAFEARLLRWLETETGAAPICCSGPSGFFWHVQLDDYGADLMVIADKKNAVATPPEGETWLLRIEEAEPLVFVPLLETLFVREARFKRKVAGKLRVQFKSSELEPGSILGTKRLNKPSI